MSNGDFKIRATVIPVLDKRSHATLMKDLNALSSGMKPIDTGFSKIAKSASKSVAELEAIATSAKSLSFALSKGTQDAMKQFGFISKSIRTKQQEAQKIVKDLESLGDEDSTEKKELQESLSKVTDSLTRLQLRGKQLYKEKEKELKQLKNVNKTQKKYHDHMKAAAQVSKTDAAKQVKGGIGSVLGGSGASRFSGLEGVAKGIGSGIQGIQARKLMDKMKGANEKQKAAQDKENHGKMLKMSGKEEEGNKLIAEADKEFKDAGAAAAEAEAGMASLGATAIVAAAALAVVVGFFMLMQKASEYQSKLNKALIEGIGNAQDLSYSVGQYENSMNEMRKSIQSTQGALKMMGVDVEESAKTMNAFARETTGSIVRTSDALNSMGTNAGQFGVNAVLYGKALGMEAHEVGSMMGKFVSEYGYSAKQAQGMTESLVASAKNANMPVHKFMNIFNETIPGLEMYTNRMETLTGIMKMLSKNMSPKGVERFMQAFSKGFQGMSLKERTGHALVAGGGSFEATSKLLKEDFGQKIDVLASGLDEKGLGNDLRKASKAEKPEDAEKQMRDVIGKATAAKVDPTVIDNIQKVFIAELNRRKGDLNVSTAMKGGDIVTMFKTMRSELKTLGGLDNGRINGIGEQIAESRGLGDKVDAFNDFQNTVQQNAHMLKTSGTTGHKSMDVNLKKVLAAATGKTADQITPEDMSKASEDQILAGAGMSDKFVEAAKSDAQKAQEFAKKQYESTTDLGTRISDIVDVLLKRLYPKLEGILKDTTEVLEWLFGTNEDKEELAIMNSAIASLDGFRATGTTKEQTDSASAQISEASPTDLPAIYKKIFGGTDLTKLGGGSNWTEGQSADDISKNMEDRMQKLMQETHLDRGKASNVLRGDTDSLTKSDMIKLMRASGINVNAKASDAYELPSAKKARLAVATEGSDDDIIGQAQVNTIRASLNSGQVSSSPEQLSSEANVSPVGGPAANTPTAPAPAPVTGAADSGLAKATLDTSEKIESLEMKTYKKMADLVNIVNKGIKLEPSFLSGDYKNTMIQAVDTGVFKNILLWYKMQQSSSFADAMVENMGQLMDSGKSAGSFSTYKSNLVGAGENENLLKFLKDAPHAATGGYVEKTGYALIHQGENVIPASTGGTGGTGGKTINISGVTINTHTDATASDVAAALYTLANKQ